MPLRPTLTTDTTPHHHTHVTPQAGQRHSLLGPNLLGFFALLEDFMFCTRIPYTAELLQKTLFANAALPAAASSPAINTSRVSNSISAPLTLTPLTLSPRLALTALSGGQHGLAGGAAHARAARVVVVQQHVLAHALGAHR